MATISSHVLDSITGTHASGILVECFARQKLDDETWRSSPVFSEFTNAEGRVSVAFDIDNKSDSYELVFHAKRYFEKQTLPDDGFQILETVVAHLSFPAPDTTVHIPLVLSPHSSTFWWSGDPPL